MNVLTPELQRRNACMLTAYASGALNLTQLGVQYGISRERVRQICGRDGVTRANRVTPLSPQFVPLDTTDLRFRFGFSSRSLLVWRTHLDGKPVRRAQVEALRQWKIDNGRDPSWIEIRAITGMSEIRIGQLWGQPSCGLRSTRDRRYHRYWSRLFRLAGVRSGGRYRVYVLQEGKSRGGGHSRLDAACRRGHPRTEANTYRFTDRDGKARRHCKDCYTHRRLSRKAAQ